MACPSCSTFTGLAYVITVLVTVLLSAVIFVLVQSAVCRCWRALKSDSGAASAGIREGEKTARYTTSSDPNYMEVGVIRERNASPPLKENEAYEAYTTPY